MGNTGFIKVIVVVWGGAGCCFFKCRTSKRGGVAFEERGKSSSLRSLQRWPLARPSVVSVFWPCRGAGGGYHMGSCFERFLFFFFLIVISSQEVAGVWGVSLFRHFCVGTTKRVGLSGVFFVERFCEVW